MRLVLMVILLLFINGGCYDLLLVENLRNKFLELHSNIITRVVNNETLQDDVRNVLKDYKPFLDELNQTENNSLNFNFILNNKNYSYLLFDSKKILNYFNPFVNIVNKAFNTKIIYDKNVLKQGYSQINYRKELNEFRNIAKNPDYFNKFLAINDDKISELYSKQELSFLFYQYLTIIDIKGLILTSFYIFITNSTQSLPTIAKYNDTLLLLNKVSDDIWKRDPEKHVKGKTYIEIEKFLQGVVTYEKHMSPFDCKKGCIDYENSTIGSKCDGLDPNCKVLFYTYSSTELYKCEELSSKLTVCPDNNPRIYKYLKFDNHIYGDKNGQCTKKEQTFIKSKSCSYCVCSMYYKRFSAKFISLRAVYATSAQNRIIVGARFAKHNNIIHIQVKEGILGPYLTVNETRWVPIENFQISDRMIFRNQDYIQLSRDQRSVILGDLKSVNTDLILTGVRFREWNGYISLQIRVTRFNLKTGRLYKKNASSWHDIVDRPTNEIKTKDLDLPMNGGSSTIVNTKRDQYIKFTHSSFETDFAQTTVPFFDAQEVYSTGPLHGMGIYYKRERKRDGRTSGGFLGIKLLTYDFRSQLSDLLKTKN